MDASDPLAIYQENLDLVSEAIMSDDMATICERIQVPFLVRMGRNEMVIEDETELAVGIREYGNGLRIQNVDNYIRLVKAARFISDSYISGWHITYVLKGAMSVVEPYRSRMVLHLQNGVWRVVQAEHELSADRWPVIGPSVLSGSVPGDFEDVEMDFRTQSESADPIYQAFLDALSDANNTHDFNRFCELTHYPLWFHSEHEDRSFMEPHEQRDFFDTVSAVLRSYKEGRLTRSADRAHFIGADRIMGYHHAHFLDGEKSIIGPIHSRMVIQHVDGVWKMTMITNTVGADELSQAHSEKSDDLVSFRKIQERMRH
ncbi:MAG: hypothetical protein AAFQ66_01590 [Pseudomonadota bacterium]